MIASFLQLSPGTTDDGVFWLVALALAIVMILAQIKLFTISKTLTEIKDQISYLAKITYQRAVAEETIDKPNGVGQVEEKRI